MKVVILAGGSGARLWPLSRESSPKQILPLSGKETLLQKTYQRLALEFSQQDILVATGKKYSRQIKSQLPGLPKKNLLLEPLRRDSAGAIGLAAAIVAANDPDEILISVHADSWVENDRAYARALKQGGRFVEAHPNYTLLFGVKPLYPETGYGYIVPDKKSVQFEKGRVFGIKKFVEKPLAVKAARLIVAGAFWNPGWFVWRSGRLLDLFKEHLPKNHAVLQKIANAPLALRTAVINREFPKLSSVSIDNGILEKAKDMFVTELSFRWSDIGHWRSLAEILPSDKRGNFSPGLSVLLDSHNNFLYSQSGKLVAAVGIRNLILVEATDAILVIDRDRAQDVKQIVASLKKNRQTRKHL